MHILLIHQAFASLQEAGGTRHFEMAKLLAEHGHKITIIASPISYITGKASSNGNHEADLSDNIVIKRVWTYAALHKSFVHRVLSFFSFMVTSFIAGISTRKVDLVWGTSPPIFQGATAWLLAGLKRKPFLFEVRDLWPSFAIAVGVLKNRTLISLSHWLEKFLYRHASVVVVNSPGYVNHVKRLGAKSCVLIPNGVDPEMFQTDSDAPNEWLAKKMGKFVVLYAGAHGISNDLTTVLRAAQTLQNLPELQFWFVGDGKEKNNLMKQADAMALTNVHFFPSVSKQEMNQVLAAADITLASLLPLEEYKTTYPNKVFDYMAAGKPVLLMIDGVIRQVVENACAGIFVPPGNAQALADTLAPLISNRAQLQEMGSNGKDYVSQNFHRRQLTEQFRALIEKLVP